MSEQITDTAPTMADATGVLPGIDGEPEPEPKGGRRRTMLLVGIAIAAGVVIGGLILIIVKPFASEESVDPAVASAAAAALAEAAELAQAEQAAGEVVPQRTNVKLTSRDPFAVLVVEPPPPPPAESTSDDGGSAAASGSSSGATMSALSVSSGGDSVTVKVDGKKYSVDEGETFASSYRLYDIFNDNCAGFLYGDQNVVVCEGDSVTVG